MRNHVATVVGLAAMLAGCQGAGSGYGPNPFLEDQGTADKADTQYLNPDGVEVEVDLEADIESGGHSWNLDEGPAALGQFALTYLRKHGDFYVESLAEDASSTSRVEWLVDGAWITARQAESTSKDKLTHFRIRSVNAILLNDARKGVKEGQVFKAPVPRNPFDVMSAAGDKCAEKDDHISLDQSVYWYLWDPDKSTCKLAQQDMSVTISKLLPVGKLTWPEYDKLIADGKVTAVVLFGQIGDGAISPSDAGMQGFREMSAWLVEAGFKAVTPAPVGSRFTKHIGDVDFEIDLYSPKEFSGLDDSAHMDNFTRALKEHEIVVYDGHSMLGASDFWAKPDLYPSTYQIFLYGGCLGYEYYVRPIVQSKDGGWANVDILSSVVEVSAGANEFAGPIFAKIAWALDHGYKASWKDLVEAVRKRVGDSTFGVSGVRENCFSPTGSVCGATPTDTGKRFDDAAGAKIPDADAAGLVREIDVGDTFTPKAVTLELDVEHTWIGDLRITLSHDGTDVVVWDHTGSSGQGISQSFELARFAGKAAKGKWTLLLVDDQAQDTGTLKKWSLVFTLP